MNAESPLEIQRDFVLTKTLITRAAAVIVRVTNRFKCAIEVGHAGETVNAKNIMKILMLAKAAVPDDIVMRDVGSGPQPFLKAGAKLKFIARGSDATSAMDAIVALFSDPNSDFG